ncbi:MAG TPA: class I SAM-dependent methyltransferase [Vicinamibacterales bacterium]|nr:class I SAM-dependent methyltransferase [Vicinamibacterales bacterium]
MRFHLFELEDQPWFPATIRDLATEYLNFVETTLELHVPVAPLLSETLKEAGTTKIVDLCAGAAGPLPILVETLAARGIPVTATLTDLYPNLRAFERTKLRSKGRIDFFRDPVDARALPRSLPGLRTLFNSFHHFRPEDALAVLRSAANDRQPIAIFEVSERTPLMILGILLVPLFVWLMTPFIHPFRWRRLFWTYLVPMVPLTCLWDGIVSQLRAYTVPELTRMGEEAGSMRWRIGQAPLPIGRGRLTYMIGIPQP